MPEIKVLPKAVAELIAAGEVVERPASVIKELVENSIDAKSTMITVEIQNGGVTFMRVTDNGCGIATDNVATAFLRHATSKVSTEDDLNEIMTLGFRGEALAAISSVSRVEMLTKTKESPVGTLYRAEGGNNITVADAGCPDGTTIIVRDLFFNTPARMKFLKKDVAEGNAVAAVLQHIALSHPEIAFRFIRDGKSVFTTPGDGKLMSAIYAVCGREFASTLIPVEGELGGIRVTGYTCKPVHCRPKKNAQFVFLNGRYVRSGTVATALDTAYKNSAMVGRFPAAVLHLTVPYGAVDINVHPAKTEVRFSDERRIFDCVHFAVKNAISAGDVRPQANLSQGGYKYRMTAEEYRQTVIPEVAKSADKTLETYGKMLERAAKNAQRPTFSDIAPKSVNSYNVGTSTAVEPKEDKPPHYVPATLAEPHAEQPEEVVAKSAEPETEINYTELLAERIKKQLEDIEFDEKPVEEPVCRVAEDDQPKPIRYIGEVFSTYILAQMGEGLFLIDKHAAHERILFNKFKSEISVDPQMLLVPQQVALKEDHQAVVDNLEIINRAGFEIEDFGDDTVLVRAVPAALTGEDVTDLVLELGRNLSDKAAVEIEKLERIFETMSCRAAVKAGNLSSDEELKVLAETVLSNRDIMYCPHGRPVAVEITRREIEKQFGRV
ncbi:MAG: DNA mismatch repair endonuclease MutL [Ruminococcaceae bacterium]|nr:DNA mismatch repair endonuclease MutL [Oscillospiraceae bacterium]